MTAFPRIGFVGLGNMGGPMCQRLVEAGYPVTVFDLNPTALERLVTIGASAGSSAADCAAQADIFLTSLPRPDHVEAVMAGENGALKSLRPGSLWIDLTTNRNELVFRLASEAPKGVKVVDSPVTGAVDGARNGKLTLFAGGEQASFDHAAPVLGHLGMVIHCGALGTGNVVKLVTNQLWFIGAAAIGEGFATGIANGVELGTLWRAIRSSVGDSFVAQHDAPSIFAGHYDPSFSLDLCLKDLRLIQELNRNVRAPLPMTTAAEGAFALAATRYGAQAAELHVARRIEDDAGLSMRLEGDWVPPWEQ
ncbi:NAD(P)-dependent oxidoreductase [Mesorhizobium sp. WSM3860]|uniref:NAD(P)-dependent oxidoreductase n=1 Tax=Mesorhizobium sp. WSM3860 TaxID=2029403 RepID=UPI0015967592|nr:NAD(P)-dependent oxidoreductase [Mesorhizobium sp. WSM3860]